MFQRKPTAKEQVRASQRELTTGVRGLEREALQLKREEARLVKEIKACAAKGNQPATRQLAKSLVRIRQQMDRLNASGAQLRGLRSNMVTAGATSTVAASMKQASQAMAALGAATDPQAMQQTMAAFSRENQKMDMASDLMGDAVDDAFDDDEEESAEIMNQVLDEIGIDLSAKMGIAPKHRAPVSNAQRNAEDEELNMALAALR